MSYIKQEVEVYEGKSAYEIAYDMREYISKGYRIHTCLDKNGKTIVVYEREIERLIG